MEKPGKLCPMLDLRERTFAECHTGFNLCADLLIQGSKANALTALDVGSLPR